MLCGINKTNRRFCDVVCLPVGGTSWCGDKPHGCTTCARHSKCVLKVSAQNTHRYSNRHSSALQNSSADRSSRVVVMMVDLGGCSIQRHNSRPPCVFTFRYNYNNQRHVCASSDSATPFIHVHVDYSADSAPPIHCSLFIRIFIF